MPAPYELGMTDKRYSAARRMVDSQYAAIQKLCWIRKQNGLTQEDIAERMGTPKFYVSRIENGHTDSRISTLRRYALACGAEISFNVTEA